MPVETATLAVFIAAAFAMQIAPGPDMMLVIGRGVGQGRRVALYTALGFTLAGVVQLPALAFGVASVVERTPIIFDTMQYAGAFYLIYLGLRLLMRPGDTVTAPGSGSVGAAVALRDGFVANLLNPKVLIFMLAFLPLFVDPARGDVWLQLLILGVAMKLCGLTVNGTIALASGSIGHWLTRYRWLVVWQRRFAGLVMVGLGLRLLFGDSARARA